MRIISNDCKILGLKRLSEVGYPTDSTEAEYAVTIGNMTFIVSNSPGLMLSYEHNVLNISTGNSVSIPPNTAAEIDMQTYIRIPKGAVMKYSSVDYPFEPERSNYTAIRPNKNHHLSVVYVAEDYMDGDDDDILEVKTDVRIFVKGNLELFAPYAMCYPRWFAINLQEFGQFRYTEYNIGGKTGDDGKIFIDETMTRYVTIKSDPIVSFEIRRGVIECSPSRQSYINANEEVTMETDFTINVPAGITAVYIRTRELGDDIRHDTVTIPTGVDYRISLVFINRDGVYNTTKYNNVKICM